VSASRLPPFSKKLVILTYWIWHQICLSKVMKILDESLLTEASNDVETPERLTMDDKDFLEILAKKAAEIEGETDKPK
jgi:hypothetical protein